MCGRARCTLGAGDISRACYRNHGAFRTVNMDRYRPSYNVSPGANLPVVRRADGSELEDLVLDCMRWGLIPSFTKKNDKPDFYRMFNARSESICVKASFRRLVPKSRCLVAVDGFYEWKKDGSKKQPYYIHFKDDRPLLFAALYDSWENYVGEKFNTFTIITTSSSSALGWLHDRMPVILGDKESIETWLNDSLSSNFDELLKPYEGSDLVWYPITPAMGKVSFDGLECINEIKLKTEGNNSITKFFMTRGARDEELNPKDTSSLDSSVKTDFPKSVKEEPEYKEDVVQPLLTAEDTSYYASFWNTEFPESVKIEPECKEDTMQLSLTAKDTTTYDSSLNTDFPESGKIEPVSNEDMGQSSSPAKCEASEKQIKRDYEEFAADSKPVINKADKMCSASPAKKKAKPKSSLNKQPTLFSYFGKS